MLTFFSLWIILGNVTFQMYFEIRIQVLNTSQLLERPKSRIPATPNAGEEMKQKELSFIAGGLTK